MYRAIIILFLVLLRSGLSQMLYNPNDERFKSLYLEKVQSDYRLQKETYDRQRILFDKGLISKQEFEQSEAAFKTAQVTYQQAVLSVAFEQPHITIDKAVKHQSRNGKTWVKLTLRNTTGGIVSGNDSTFEGMDNLRTDRIANVYVSLLNDEHAVVSQPYEAKIPVMKYNEPVTVDFVLLQDLDYVTVKEVRGDKSEERKILLQMDESANRVLITLDQFSQEVDLGSDATFGLTLALFSDRSYAYRLGVVNLPRQISCDFFDTQAGGGRNARVSQVKFCQDASTRQVSLAAYLPDRYDSTSFTVDKPIDFFAVAIPEGPGAEDFDQTRMYAASDLDKLHISYARLEIVPRGTGKISVRTTNYYQEIKPGDRVNMTLTVHNDGTRTLDNVRTRTDLPAEWMATISPDLIESLSPGKDQTVSVTLIPPARLAIGDYEATMKTIGFAGNKQIDGENKSIRIHVSPSGNVLETAMPLMLILGILVGVVTFGIRMSRR
ncbi:MAG TPA: NEW3 domain-containing protein [Candidatus Acidoferrales bacterium]|nr:NEW3 domain-containing protein [Candidatus Acidoferrales bacterium]